MFSMEYFKYLIKSKRYLILLIGLVTLLNIVGSKESTGVFLQSILSIVLAYLLPVYIFYYNHDKKAVDTFYSIPVSRKALLITGVLFIIGLIYIPLALTVIPYMIRKAFYIFDALLFLLKLLLAVSAIVIFVSSIYSLVNNAVDGIIMLGAYSFLPIMTIIVADNFLRVFVCGVQSFDLKFLGYLSPVFMAGDVFVNKILNTPQILYSCTGLVIYLIVCSVVLYLNNVDRKVERANTLSNNIFTYPFIITIYLVLVLLQISSFTSADSFSIVSAIKDNFIMYLVLFAIFISANFIYKRKLHFNYVLPALFVLALLATLLFANYAKSTRGFGLSDSYVKNNKQSYYQLYYYESEPHLMDKDTRELLWEYSKKNSEYINVTITVGDYETVIELDKKARKPLSDKALDNLNKYREEAIEAYYKTNENETAWTQLYVLADENGKTKHYNYRIPYTFTLKQLIDMVDSDCEVTLSNEIGEYKLLKDGTLEVLYEYSS